MLLTLIYDEKKICWECKTDQSGNIQRCHNPLHPLHHHHHVETASLSLLPPVRRAALPRSLFLSTLSREEFSQTDVHSGRSLSWAGRLQGPHQSRQLCPKWR